MEDTSISSGDEGSRDAGDRDGQRRCRCTGQAAAGGLAGARGIPSNSGEPGNGSQLGRVLPACRTPQWGLKRCLICTYITLEQCFLYVPKVWTFFFHCRNLIKTFFPRCLLLLVTKQGRVLVQRFIFTSNQLITYYREWMFLDFTYIVLSQCHQSQLRKTMVQTPPHGSPRGQPVPNHFPENSINEYLASSVNTFWEQSQEMMRAKHLRPETEPKGPRGEQEFCYASDNSIQNVKDNSLVVKWIRNIFALMVTFWKALKIYIVYKTFNETVAPDFKGSSPEIAFHQISIFKAHYGWMFNKICFTSISVSYKTKQKKIKSLKTPVLLHIYADSAWKWQSVYVGVRNLPPATAPLQVFPADAARTVERKLYASLRLQTAAGCLLVRPHSPCRRQTWSTRLSKDTHTQKKRFLS